MWSQLYWEHYPQCKSKSSRTYESNRHKSDRSALRFFAIDSVPVSIRGGDRVANLRRLESRYIIDLDSKTPHGLNGGEEMMVHLGRR